MDYYPTIDLAYYKTAWFLVSTPLALIISVWLASK